MDAFHTQFISETQLPVVATPKNKNLAYPSFLEILRESRPWIREQTLKYGGILFRSCPVETARQFSELIHTLGLGEPLHYIGGDSPRIKVHDCVYTSTEAPPGVKIPLHNEMSFIQDYPRHIYFFCETAPQDRGFTMVADARRVLQKVDPEVTKRFEEKGLRYISRYYHKSRFMDLVNRIQKGHKSWIDVFETDSKVEVARLCREKNFDFRWLSKDWIEVSQQGPTTLTHETTGDQVWFNQVHLYDYNPKFLGWPRYLGVKAFYCLPDTLVHECSHLDGSKISREALYHIMDVMDEESIYFPWERGDILVLDNVLAMHGRAPFRGNRRILAALSR